MNNVPINGQSYPQLTRSWPRRQWDRWTAFVWSGGSRARRNLLLTGLLLSALVALAVIVARRDRPHAVMAGAISESSPSISEQAGNAGEMPAAVADSPQVALIDIFAVRTWQPKTSNEIDVVAAAEAAPEQPPLPFRFIGRITAPGKPTAFLLNAGNRVIIARVGDRVEPSYRFIRYNKGQLMFETLPGKQQQVLDIGEAP